MVKKILRSTLLLVLGGMLLAGCNWRASWMLRTDKDYEFDVPPDTIATAYKLSANDIVTFRLFANDGFKLIDLSNSAMAASQSNNTFQFLIEQDGTLKLPIVGHVNITGMTLREAELLLEKEYSDFYNKPFVMLNVVNRRVIVFPGAGGEAQVIRLTNQSTSLIEGLAMAGGISTGKARNVKLIRGDPNNPIVYQFDLSTIEGVNAAGMILQANDIIYVEPVLDVSDELLRDLSPILTLLTSVLIAIVSVRNF
ncbi:MAG: polysaccharide biosynthesis/export family protein [Salibacteraceae bacterium]